MMLKLKNRLTYGTLFGGNTNKSQARSDHEDGAFFIIRKRPSTMAMAMQPRTKAETLVAGPQPNIYTSAHREHALSHHLPQYLRRGHGNTSVSANPPTTLTIFFSRKWPCPPPNISQSTASTKALELPTDGGAWRRTAKVTNSDLML